MREQQLKIGICMYGDGGWWWWWSEWEQKKSCKQKTETLLFNFLTIFFLSNLYFPSVFHNSYHKFDSINVLSLIPCDAIIGESFYIEAHKISYVYKLISFHSQIDFLIPFFSFNNEWWFMLLVVLWFCLVKKKEFFNVKPNTKPTIVSNRKNYWTLWMVIK